MLLCLANLVSKISSFSLHCFSASLHRFFSFSKSSVAVASKSSNFFVLGSRAAREDSIFLINVSILSNFSTLARLVVTFR